MSDIEQKEDETQKEYIARLKKSLQEERAHPKSDDPMGPIDYLGSILYAHACMSRGVTPAPWWKLDDQLKEQFRQQSRETVASWAMEQLQMAAAK